MTTLFTWGSELPRLQGQRIALRALVDEDAPALLAIFGDPEVIKYWVSPSLRDLGAAKELVGEIRQKFNTRRVFQWGIVLLETDEVIGTCGLGSVFLAHRRAEVGFVLRRTRWGQGLATEALRILLTFCFETLDLHRIEADVDPQNERSLRVLERQGFRREGFLRERWHHLGDVRDGIFLGLLRGEWTRKDGAHDAVAADNATMGSSV
jgi:RimJ/RimL family protein N-acetyltransferase